MIPLLLIPQMILSGLLFSFDKLNNVISTKGKVPVIADVMASRWAYEALAVYQFKNNSFEAPYFDIEKEEQQADFKAAYLVEELRKRNRFVTENFKEKNDSIQKLVAKDLNIIRMELMVEPFRKGWEKIDIEKELVPENFSETLGKAIEGYLLEYQKVYQKMYNEKVALRERKIAFFENQKDFPYSLNDYKNRYYNESLADLVMNISEKDRILEYQGKLIQQINPIFMDPKTTGPLDYRAQFFAPHKNFLGIQLDTFWFDLIVVWIMSAMLYVTLYFEWLKKLLDRAGNLKIPVKGKK